MGTASVLHLMRVEPAVLRTAVSGVTDHPLGEQALERLVERDVSHVVECLGDEPRVQQMQNGVFHSADVLVDREPVVDVLLHERDIVAVGRDEAQVIPGGVDERVHRVSVAPRRPATDRAFRLGIARDVGEPLLPDELDIGQEDG